jgi:hypothetical protein
LRSNSSLFPILAGPTARPEDCNTFNLLIQKVPLQCMNFFVEPFSRGIFPGSIMPTVVKKTREE